MTVAPAAGGGRGPTAARIQLGAHLRRLRQARDVTREAAGYHIRASESKISRMELGRVSCKVRDVADLLTFYGAADDERDALLELAGRATEPEWWQRLGDVVPQWVSAYLGLEQAAALIRSYELHFVPALLQTPDYARALIRLVDPAVSRDEQERRVALVQGRRRALFGEEAGRLWAVVDENALRRVVGDERVMRDQLASLIADTELPNVQLQVADIPPGVVATAGLAFTVLRFGEPELPDLVYAELPTTALYLDRPADVEHYAVAMERACAGAEPPGRTADRIQKILSAMPSAES